MSHEEPAGKLHLQTHYTLGVDEWRLMHIEERNKYDARGMSNGQDSIFTLPQSNPL